MTNEEIAAVGQQIEKLDEFSTQLVNYLAETRRQLRIMATRLEKAERPAPETETKVVGKKGK